MWKTRELTAVFFLSTGRHSWKHTWTIRSSTKKIDDFTSESTDLVLGVEHPDLSSDPATCQDVGLLVVQGEGGPGKRVEVLLDILVLVLHQDRPGVDVDDADAVSSAGGHVRSCLVVVFRVRLKDNLKQ